MTETDKKWEKMRQAIEADKKANAKMSRIYRGYFKDRSGLSDADFAERKSKGRYSWK